jgi:CheY-like chemotaxis protein
MRPHDNSLVQPPAATGPAAESGPPIPPFPERPGVLVVDDEHFVRSILQLGLERHGFEVWPASGGREAVRLYQAHRHRIRVVLLDVRMPGLDGPGTLDALRELNPGVVACFMGGDLGACDQDELLRRGAVRVVTKPFHVNELADDLLALVK